MMLVIAFAAGWAYNEYVGLPAFAGKQVGEAVDSLNGVYVYNNGSTGNISGRNKTADGYNLGLKYQCVEFVKRYYYEHLHHKMPDSYGHAKDLFDQKLKDGSFNAKRGLTQYRNGSRYGLKMNDILVFGTTQSNSFGHVAVISRVKNGKVEIIQQNPGRFSRSRESYELVEHNGSFTIKNERILGWLRKGS